MGKRSERVITSLADRQRREALIKRDIRTGLGLCLADTSTLSDLTESSDHIIILSTNVIQPAPCPSSSHAVQTELVV